MARYERSGFTTGAYEAEWAAMRRGAGGRRFADNRECERYLSGVAERLGYPLPVKVRALSRKDSAAAKTRVMVPGQRLRRRNGQVELWEGPMGTGDPNDWFAPERRGLFVLVNVNPDNRTQLNMLHELAHPVASWLFLDTPGHYSGWTSTLVGLLGAELPEDGLLLAEQYARRGVPARPSQAEQVFRRLRPPSNTVAGRILEAASQLGLEEV